MAFSVLMSLYCKEKPEYLVQCLDSVFNQTLRADEVILVEDGPLTPELYKVVEYYKHNNKELVVIPLEKNGGLGNALNEGLKYCTYDIVARMDTDDVAFPNRFQRQVGELDLHPEYDVVSSWVIEFEGTPENVIGINHLPETCQEIKEYAKMKCPVAHSATVFRKKSVLAAGGYFVKYFPEDYYLWVKMLHSGCIFYNIQEPLIYFRTSLETMKKRGGIKYALDEYRVEKMMLNIGFISFLEFLRNCVLRCGMRIIPTSLRGWIYKKYKYKK